MDGHCLPKLTAYEKKFNKRTFKLFLCRNGGTQLYF